MFLGGVAGVEDGNVGAVDLDGLAYVQRRYMVCIACWPTLYHENA